MHDITLVNSGLLMKGISVPIGPLIIAAALQEEGYKVDFRDYQGKDLNKRFDPKTFKEFCKSDSKILGISATCNSMPLVLGAIELIKEEDPDKIIILGGPGPSDLVREILKGFPADFIVIGEGEKTIIELINAIKKGEDYSYVKGIAYKKDRDVVINPLRERIIDISKIPHPAYNLINLNEYDSVATVITSRGCPFNCKFCSANSIWNRKMTYRDIDDIVSEVKYLSKYSDVIAFADDTFVLDKKRAKDIIYAIRAEGINLPWACNAKITLMDKEWFSFMEKTNCIQVFYGIEAGSDKILERIGKGHTVEQARKVIAETAGYISNVRTSYIWGYPFETIDDFYDLVQMLYQDMQIPNVYSQMSLLSPLPSSDLYKEYGANIEFRVDAQSRAGGLPVDLDIVDYPEMIEFIKKYPKLFSSFYYYKHDDFDLKLNAIKKIDWIYDEDKVKEYGY